MSHFMDNYYRSRHKDYHDRFCDRHCFCICQRNLLCCRDPFIDFRCPLFSRQRLAGLQGSLNFQLFRFKGCPIVVELECCDGKVNVVEGRICNVGIDFVDIIQDGGRHEDKSCDRDRVVTILLDRICNIVWPDKDCSPCRPNGCDK